MCYILPPFSTEAGEVHVVWRVLKMLGASPAPLHDKVVLHAVDDGVVLGVHPCLSQCALVCRVLGVSLGICVGRPGPWILSARFAVSHRCSVMLVLSLVSAPMPEPVRSSLQGPWCLTGDLCWASRSLDLVRKVRCVPSMLCYVGVVLGVFTHA